MARLRSTALLLLLPVLLLAWIRAEAIPAFARKYQMSCSTCHAPFPRLKPYGEEFAARGFRLEDPSKEPTRATYDVGDPMLNLPRDLPLAVRLDGHFAYKQDALAEADTEWPAIFKLLSGGPITKKISYYVYFIIENNDVVGLEDIWMQFNDVADIPMDIQVGQFQVCDPIFKRELRLERFDYEIFKTHVGEVAVDLTYDRGAYFFWHLPEKVDILMALVNGNGIEAADDLGNFDKDSYKNVALRAAWTQKKFRLGLLGYFGKERAENRVTDRTFYYGPDFTVTPHDKWQISGEYLFRRDDNPFFDPAGSPWFDTSGGFLEVHFFPKGQDGRWALSLLYNKVISDDRTARVETASLTGNYLIARNVRLAMEAGRDIEYEQWVASVGIVTAF